MPPQQGLGPLYGIRHESFFASSFYVKSAIRPARDGRPELLAVGSSRYTPLIFPTDERYLEYMALSNQVSATLPSSAEQLSLPPPHYDHGPTAWSSSASSQPSSASMSRPSAGNSAALANNGRGLDTIPIYRLGTPLVRGHSKEAGAVAWTSEGQPRNAERRLLRASLERRRGPRVRPAHRRRGRPADAGTAAGPMWSQILTKTIGDG